MREIEVEEREFPVPEVVDVDGNADLVDGDAVFEPGDFEIVQRPSVGNALQLHGRLPFHSLDVLKGKKGITK